MPVKTLLVANRGEVAVRILSTAAALGLRTVAVHPADDERCAHVRRADRAVQLPGSGVAAYLDAAAVLAAAQDADAVHPGYGFLSESAAFARRCAAAGPIFVGPDPETLDLFGDKTATRRHAADLDIPVPAGTGPVDIAGAREFLAAHPAGVMVKAVAGGGGRGTAPVLRADELDDVFRRCRSEAEHAFGDGTLYVEQLLASARHLEVQLVGDGTGTVVAVGDRDCSVQRRRQKLVELAPAPDVDRAVRSRLAEHAVRLGESARLRGLATVEFLVDGTEIALIEVNPRLQVEHTVTEEVTGLDLVEIGLRIADGATLRDLGLTAPPAVRGAAVQVRVNAETVQPDGSVLPSAGVLDRFGLPTGRGVRVDTHGYPGYEVGLGYDSLLAKVVTTGSDATMAVARSRSALAELDIAGVATTAPLLRAVLEDPAVGEGKTAVDWLERVLPDLVTPETVRSDEYGTVTAPTPGVVVEIAALPGDTVASGAPLLVLEAMKMEHVVAAPFGCTVVDVVVPVGTNVRAGDLLAHVVAADGAEAAEETAAADPAAVRADLEESIARHGIGLDSGRPEAVAKRHRTGLRTARENVADLCDPGTFVEYGALAVAGRRKRMSEAELIERTPADGLITGTGEIDGQPCAVMAYDYMVMAGTQGIQNHRKTDRLFELAMRHRLPLVMYVEGGGGRPGDGDTTGISLLDGPTFRRSAELAGAVPTVAVVAGYCFAGNAALAGVADIIVGVEGANLGMGGPSMIEGGGLGIVEPTEIGPMDVQVPNGVVDVLARDEAEATAVARRYIGYCGPRRSEWEAPDQLPLRAAVPENRVRVYDVRPVLQTVVDVDSYLELRPEFGAGMITALARIEGRAVGILANDPRHLGGAIDGPGADKAARFLRICGERSLPVVTFCDTPGFMVGVESERSATVRRFGDMFVWGARLTAPLCTVVLRKGYGLGAIAMTGGSFHTPELTVSWPTGEFGGMNLEGQVRLSYRNELAAIDDPAERQRFYEEQLAHTYRRGKALSVASAFEIDDVIDPAETRATLARAFDACQGRNP